MTRFTATRSINARIDLVFKTISDINNFSKSIPDVINVNFYQMLNQVSERVFVKHG
ncbi:hypothetical protein IID10_13680 [candidate division KSB1 bacterium]|nr:hypothetical protein [candidate division KSB1 bacterium]